MINLILTNDGSRLINLGQTSKMEVKPSPMDAGKFDIIVTQDGLDYTLATYSSKEMAKSVISDITIWNNINYMLEREYRMPADDPEWEASKAEKLFGMLNQNNHPWDKRSGDAPKTAFS